MRSCTPQYASCEEAGITLESRALTFFSHWITPIGISRRFDTYFFVAAAPPGAVGVADSVETHDARWLTPKQALEAHRRGEMHMFFPTIKHLGGWRHSITSMRYSRLRAKNPS